MRIKLFGDVYRKELHCKDGADDACEYKILFFCYILFSAFAV